MIDKTLYPNSTQVPNGIIDEMAELSNSELRIILLITRKTIGWHKETDYIAYSQIRELTGLSKQSVVDGVNGLLEKGLIVRLDDKENSLRDMPNGFRGKIFYTLAKTIEPVKKIDRSKTYNRTGLKNRPYKTNSNKTNINTVPSSTGVNEKVIHNGDNLVDKSHRGNGIASIGSLLSGRELPTLDKNNRIYTPWQDHALRIAEKLGIKADSAWFKLFKDLYAKNKISKLDSAYSRTIDAGARDTRKYFYWAVAN